MKASDIMDDMPEEIKAKVLELSEAMTERIESMLGSLYRSELDILMAEVYPLYIEGNPLHETLDDAQKLAIREFFAQMAGEALAQAVSQTLTQVVAPRLLADYLVTEICIDCGIRESCGNFRRLSRIAAGEEPESELPEEIKNLIAQARAMGGEVRVVSGPALGDMDGFLEAMMKGAKKRAEGEENPLAE